MSPIKAHVHRFGSAVYNCVSDDYIGDNVVKLKWFWDLDVAHFMQGIEKWHSVFAVHET